MPVENSTITPDVFLKVRDVTKTFGEFVALDHVSMTVNKGEFVSILGPSGCGKTTLLRVIAGLEHQNAGSIWLDGRDVTREPVAKRKLGIVFQSYALFPNITVLGNVIYGIPRAGQSGAQRRERGMAVLDLVGLTDQALKYPAQLSGGQQQRVALARALAPEPSLLLLDEPLSALDARVRVHLRKEIRRIQDTLGVTTIMVTHDQEEALTMAHRVLVIKDGRLMQFASPQTLYKSPANAFVASFIGSMNFLTGCCFSDTNALSFGQYTLNTLPGRTTGSKGHPVTVAVRSEDIRIIRNKKHTTNNIINARINDIEFRGALYRIHLQVLHHSGDIAGQVLEMDLQSETVEDMNLKGSMELPLHLPPDKLLVFAN